MSQQEPVPELDISVAIIRDSDGRILWVWNDRWSAYVLPMTKRQGGPGHHLETSAFAAARAAAEVLRVPVQVSPESKCTMTLNVSGADAEVKFYAYEAFEVATHPDYQEKIDIRVPALWLTAQEAASGDYQPLTASSLEILENL